MTARIVVYTRQNQRSMCVIVIRHRRDIGIIALALAVVFALPYACMVHCMLASHTAHHMDHCTMPGMTAPLITNAAHTPLMHTMPYIPPALHIGVLFGSVQRLLGVLFIHLMSHNRLWYGYQAPPLTPPPR